MNTTTLRLHRPWWHRAADQAAALLHKLQGAWQHWQEQRLARREIEAALEIDPATLRDIGAPLWLQEMARERREQLRFGRDLHLLHDRQATRPYY